MKRRLVAVFLLATLAYAPIAQAQQGMLPLVTLGGNAYVTTKSAKLAKVLKSTTIDLSPIRYQGTLIAVAAALVVIDPQSSLDGSTVVGPKKAPIKSMTVELSQKNANGSTSSLGKQTASWGELNIPGFDPEDLGLPADLPMALAFFLVPAPPAGASHRLTVTLSGGAGVPPAYAVVLGGGGIDVGSLGLDAPSAASLVNALLGQTEGMIGLDRPIARAQPLDIPQR